MSEKLIRHSHFLLDRNFALLQRVNDEVLNMAAELERLRQEVAESKSVTASAVALIQGLRDELANIVRDGVDPQAVADLANELDASTAELAKAVVKDTKADPGAVGAEPEPPAPVVPPTDGPVTVEGEGQ